MRKVVVLYTDAMDFHETTYECGPYPGTQAKDVMRNLRLMGCENLETKPYIEKKVA